MPTKTDPTGSHPKPLLLSRKQTAAVLAGISVWTVDDLVRAGKLTAKKLGARVVFDADEVARFANELPAWEPK